MEREVGKMILKGLDMRIQWTQEFKGMQLQYQREAMWEAMEGLKQEFAETFLREGLSQRVDSLINVTGS